jgi:ADP-heptose:LPS heptosyltransferase
MAVDPEAALAVRHSLEQAGISDKVSIVVMHVSAGNPFRRWPIPSFASVAASLVRARPTRAVVITSGPSDTDAAARVIVEARAMLPERDRSRIAACAEFSLSELRALFERSALYVGGDSGPLHIAASSRIPIVGLYGPTLPARSAPWRPAYYRSASVEVEGLPCRPCDQRACVPRDYRCLTAISPQQVIDAAEGLLAEEAR